MAGTFGLSAGAEPPRRSRPGKSGRGARRRKAPGPPVCPPGLAGFIRRLRQPQPAPEGTRSAFFRTGRRI